MVPQAAAAAPPRQLPAHNIPRPPTPPRDVYNIEEHLPKLDCDPSKSLAFKHSSNFTPDSSAESPNQENIGGTARKKVNWPDNHEAASSPVVEPLPLSGERKPLKSILKTSNGSNSFNLGPPTKLSPPHAYPNLAAMLESIVQQLAGDDRNSKMDAYTTLSGTIQASDNVPELRALKDRIFVLLQFMRRDMTARTSAGTWDTSLIVNDLKLLSSFLHKKDVADILATDFCIFVIDHAIKTFEDPGMSKDVVKHLLPILAAQRFSPKIMSSGRVGKLFTALHNIETFVKGKSIVTGRLDIYRNLVRYSTIHMVAHASDWMEDLFTSMDSSHRDTRASAITFGLEAALVLGTESKVSRALMELFQKGAEGSMSTFGDYFISRLKDMVSKKQEGGSVTVPQIWSVPILFLRCRSRQFERWVFMNKWLGVISDCFNSSDIQTKLEANLAWNRLVFAVRPDETTSKKLAAILCRPLLDQLKRKHHSGNASKSRKATISSICFLLYYSLRPNSTPAQLEVYWDEYVTQIVGKTLTPANIVHSPELARQDLTDGCHILKALFDSTTARPFWNENRAMEFDPLKASMQMSELPALDSKWLRKNASRVFPVMYPLLEKLYWDLSDEGTISTKLWKAYVTSIASPAIKEVKVSVETMACVARIFDLIYRIWQTGPDNMRSLSASNGTGQHDFLGSFGNIVLTTLEGLGLLPFTERLLSMGTQDVFIVIATPSQRPRNSGGQAQCPLHHLFVLFTIMCPGLQYDWKFSQMVRQILTPFFDARSSSKGQMDLVKELLQLLPTESTEPSKMLWQILADFATVAADTRDGKSVTGNVNVDQPLGVEYRNALKILETGVELSPLEPLPGWKSLFEALVTSSTIDAGDGGRAIALIEPLARTFAQRFLKDQPSSTPMSGLEYCRMLVSKATYPKDRQALDAARRKMWGASNTGQKASTFDPYMQLYDYLRACLETAYASLSRDSALDSADLLSATTALLNRCPSPTFGALLEKLQNGIGCWILDGKSKLVGGNPLSQAVSVSYFGIES
jgi:hypothetical protein